MTEVITWRGWTAEYSPQERKLMPKNVREAEFIHELKARFGGVLMDGSVSIALRDLDKSGHFPIPERARLELDLMEDVV